MSCVSFIYYKGNQTTPPEWYCAKDHDIFEHGEDLVPCVKCDNIHYCNGECTDYHSDERED